MGEAEADSETACWAASVELSAATASSRASSSCAVSSSAALGSVVTVSPDVDASLGLAFSCSSARHIRAWWKAL